MISPRGGKVNFLREKNLINFLLNFKNSKNILRNF
jgi:hypothetical protein